MVALLCITRGLGGKDDGCTKTMSDKWATTSERRRWARLQGPRKVAWVSFYGEDKVAVMRFFFNDFQAVMVAGCNDQRPELNHNFIFFGSVASRSVRDELEGVRFFGIKAK